MPDRYFLQRDDEPEIEVTVAEFRNAERSCGFWPKGGGELDLATAGFSWSSHGRSMSGRIKMDPQDSTEFREMMRRMGRAN